MDGTHGRGDGAADGGERPIDRLIAIMARLRDPERGCPWDVRQTFATIAPYTVEEAYEVADAIARGDMEDLEEELGDLLLQVVFHARMAEEAGLFAFDDVATAIADKLVRRHPHVFGDATADDAAAVKATWEEIKRREKAARAARRGPERASRLDGVPLALPALSRAAALQKKAAAAGFDWPDDAAGAAALKAKVAEEIDELDEALAGGEAAADHAVGEFGDLLFALVNVARRQGIAPEEALSRTNAKFAARFRAMEEAAERDGTALEALPLADLDALWDAAKRAERTGR